MEPTEHNRRAWDEIHRRRSETLADQLGIPGPVKERLPEVKGKHVLHLQCATGESTAELAELGALVTGVDISAEALAVARERVPDAALVQADVHELPLQFRRGRFDLVYTGGGVLHWLQDLDTWAQAIASALKPGGELLLYDTHPVSACVDRIAHWREDYFNEDTLVDVGWKHFDLEGDPPQEAKHERFWRLGQVVTALAQARLVIRSLEEFPTIYETFWRERDPRVPGEFVLRAAKPS
ncbi:MAG: class I SAM-dependent methyltransferase [Actinomycetota bacterium]|nr:class I SAM-dependent methyltransferase [Actinomycetota bacterium]